MLLKKHSSILLFTIVGTPTIHCTPVLIHLFEMYGKVCSAHENFIEKIFFGKNKNTHKNDYSLFKDPTTALQGDAEKVPHDSPNTPVHFDEIIGIDEVLIDIKEIVEYVKNPTKYTKLGAKPYKGILLEGPPGSGKTMIAKAIATEANCNIVYASASSFVEMYVGVGAKRIRELFEKARKAKPCIIFIDELDAVGAVSRGAGANEEYRQTLNELLCQMDGFKGDEGIIVIAATNHAKALDSALKRAGRFDRIITIPLPNLEARLKMVQHAKAKLPSAEISDEYLQQLAKDTCGLTASDLNNIFNEAALLAVRQDAKVVNDQHMATAAKKIIGERRK